MKKKNENVHQKNCQYCCSWDFVRFFKEFLELFRIDSYNKAVWYKKKRNNFLLFTMCFVVDLLKCYLYFVVEVFFVKFVNTFCLSMNIWKVFCLLFGIICLMLMFALHSILHLYSYLSLQKKMIKIQIEFEIIFADHAFRKCRACDDIFHSYNF